MSAARMRSVLAFAVLLLVLALLWMLDRGRLVGENRDIALVVVGAILAQLSGVYDFFFGSSDGSKEKGDQLAARALDEDCS